MLLKMLSGAILIQIVVVNGYSTKFMIKNKKTAMVLEATQDYIEMTEWQNKDSQQWGLETMLTGYSLIGNVATRYVLEAHPTTKLIVAGPKHYGINQNWIRTSRNETRLQVEFYPNEFLIQKGNKVILGSQQSDESDLWELIDAEPWSSTNHK